MGMSLLMHSSMGLLFRLIVNVLKSRGAGAAAVDGLDKFSGGL